ncbi:MAG: SGNH/GDSL hydrolase family protein [Eubacteriales bacterium]|nr:SGNH/GDSL hydrolase family protein [Eubacteriales bacterium]
MRILMLGNSFTYFNDMPKLLAQMLGEEVVAHTRGGAFLSEQLNEEAEMGMQTLRALREEKWDYVVLQEQSRAPIFCKEKFHESVRGLCALIRAAGAKPVLYASWAYREGSEKLAGTEMSYAAMDEGLYASYHEAAQENDALVADVGRAFTAVRGIVNLYEADDYHPSAAGSMLAAHVIAKTIEEDRRNSK